MKLLVALALFTVISTADGYKCYLCGPTDSQPCQRTVNCETSFLDRCYKSETLGLVSQGCMKKELCVGPVHCCEGDLCNSAPLSLASLLLLGLSAFVTLYLNQD